MALVTWKLQELAEGPARWGLAHSLGDIEYYVALTCSASFGGTEPEVHLWGISIGVMNYPRP